MTTKEEEDLKPWKLKAEDGAIVGESATYSELNAAATQYLKPLPKHTPVYIVHPDGREEGEMIIYFPPEEGTHVRA